MGLVFFDARPLPGIPGAERKACSHKTGGSQSTAFRMNPATASGSIHLEAGFDPAAVAALVDRQHDVVSGISGFDRVLFGRGQIIMRDENGALTGGSDGRADGCAIEVVTA